MAAARSRVSASIQTDGISELAVTLKMYQARLTGPVIRQAQQEIATAFATMEYERFISDGAAPLFGINNKWEPASDAWVNWKVSKGYAKGTLRFTNELMRAATHPTVTPTGTKAMRISIDSPTYGILHQEGMARNGIKREWVTITPEFRAIAVQIMEAFIIPGRSEIKQARADVRSQYGHKRIREPQLKKYEAKKRELPKKYEASKKKSQQNLKEELNYPTSHVDLGNGLVMADIRTPRSPLSDFTKKSGVLMGSSYKKIDEVHASITKHQSQIIAEFKTGKISANQMDYELAKRVASETNIGRMDVPGLVKIQREFNKPSRSSRAADGFTRP